MKQSRSIEVIHPTLRRRASGTGWPLVNVLTLGAAVLAIVLSVSLSSAANTDTCARPIDLGTGQTPVSVPCAYR